MDELSQHHYELTFKVQFMTRRGTAFQDFFADIMAKRYPADFIRVRPWGPSGDRKNDGYLRSQRILFQCYGPNEIKARECIAKIDEDFAGALPYWEQYFSTWVFVHNGIDGLGPDVTARLLELNDQHKNITVLPWGFDELRREVFGLSAADLAALLGPAPSRSAMMDLGLADLIPVLEQIERLPAPADVDLRPVPPEKLEYNLLSPAVASFLRLGMQRAPLVRRYFTRRPTEQDRIAANFRRQYDQHRATAMTPDQIFTALQRFAGGERVSSPTRQCAVLACLAFFFEECDIFDRPELTETT